MTNLRIGHGYDVHRLVQGTQAGPGRRGHPMGAWLDGHSDADVLVHAVMDALLGAAGLEDIGCLFPDGDDAYLGISSILLLQRVSALLKESGNNRGECGRHTACPAPKLAPYRQAMRENIARALDIPAKRVGVKATTEEHLGFTGEELGMAAHAVALVELTE